MQAVYRSKVRIGYTKDGKPIDKYVSGHTKEELENVKQACREHYVEGRPIPKEQLFYEYAEEWYTVRKEPFISASSRSAYKSCFMKHILPQFGLQNLRAVTSSEIQTFINNFTGTSKSQINLVIGILHGVFSTAFAEGLIERDPTAALIRPKARKRETRRALTEDETKRVLNVIKTHPDGLFLAVLYYLSACGVAKRWDSVGAILRATRCISSATSTTAAQPRQMTRSRPRPPTATYLSHRS